MARKKPPKLPVEPEEDDLEWLREAYTDALDHGAHVSHENAELRLENARLTEEIANLRKQVESQGKIRSPERSDLRSPPPPPKHFPPSHQRSERVQRKEN